MARGTRRRGREAALQFLYQVDLTEAAGTADFELFWDHLPPKAKSPEARELSLELVEAVLERRDEFDGVIDGACENWDVSRLSRVDRNVLRIGVCELLCTLDVPGAVVIDEAVEVARRFSDERSAAFINGVLDRVARDLGRLAAR